MKHADIPFLSATELSQLIEKKEVSPVEATEAYLNRIDDQDFKYNAYLTVARKQALQAAQEAERAIAGGNYLGPMHGIPVAVKDQLWSKDVRTTGGSRILMDFIPDDDSTVVANLKKAGAIMLGKTNVTEFAITGFTHRFSTPRNPWNLDMYTGGSSSGSGAATAAFLCATSLGEDTGGSIRMPATWCGLVGLRPSWGRVSRYGVMKGVWSMDTVGPISRTVSDAAITIGAIAGHDPKDPYTWNTPVPDYTKALDGNISGMRVGMITEMTNSDLVEPEVRETVVKATTVLGELGASVEEVSLPFVNYASITSSILLGVQPGLNHKDWIRDRLQDYGHDNRIGLLVGSIMPAQAYYKAEKLRSMIRQQVHEAFEKYDVLVLPTSGKPAQPVADDPMITSKETASRLPYLLTRLFNLASATAVSVPCGHSSQGLPIGLQIGGRPGGEETVLKVAHAYEQNTSWHTMRPPTV
jgi:aspartyl-tRNA(Asn)/glutamyl-tRNA(Gln) amidotransferase subunit A